MYNETHLRCRDYYIIILFCSGTFFRLLISIGRLWFKRLNYTNGHQCFLSSSVKYVSNVTVQEPAKARDRRALQQLALNVHVKHSDLT